VKVLQINTSINVSAPGRIASEIGDVLLDNGHESFVAYGRICRQTRSSAIKIGSNKDLLLHVFNSRLVDRHGFSSEKATVRFIDHVKEIDPDLIHLHNLHGYYIHVGVLFKYLKESNKPVVWTFHDCWPFTGHCSYFDRANCSRWQSECFKCPLKRGYPASWFLDNSTRNYILKKETFGGLNNLTLVSPSDWLSKHLANSFLKQYPVKIINNGLDLEKFKPFDPTSARNKWNLSGKHIILGVANIWSSRKGFDDFIKLRTLLDSQIEIVLVGLTPRHIKNLPTGIRGICRTDSIEDLSSLYSAADVFVNPTWIDNFPTVNLEALACGTPVVTYDTGGSVESIDNETGRFVPKGDVLLLKTSIVKLISEDRHTLRTSCRNRAEKLYDAKSRYCEYLTLYEQLKDKRQNSVKS